MEGARFVAINARVDYSATVDELGVSGRPLAESMRDSACWLADAGHIGPRAAGRSREA